MKGYVEFKGYRTHITCDPKAREFVAVKEKFPDLASNFDAEPENCQAVTRANIAVVEEAA